MFLTRSHYFMEAEIDGERVNCGESYVLEIPVPYHFLGPAKAIEKRGFPQSKLSFQTQKRCPLYIGVRYKLSAVKKF